MSLESPTELRISEWISLANECNIFVTLGLDCNRVDRSQNGTCNAELSSIKPESRESIQSKITEPACAEFSATQVGNSAKQTNHSVRSDKTSAVPYFLRRSTETCFGSLFALSCSFFCLLCLTSGKAVGITFWCQVRPSTFSRPPRFSKWRTIVRHSYNSYSSRVIWSFPTLIIVVRLRSGFFGFIFGFVGFSSMSVKRLRRHKSSHVRFPLTYLAYPFKNTVN